MRMAMMVLAVLVAAPAFAAPDCSKAMTQADIDECMAAPARAADAQLNADYRAVMARLSPGSRNRLQAAQRSWLQFRDAECAFRSMGQDGGSVAPATVASCVADLTKRRAADLASLRTCKDGDTSCPR